MAKHKESVRLFAMPHVQGYCKCGGELCEVRGFLDHPVVCLSCRTIFTLALKKVKGLSKKQIKAVWKAMR